MPSGTRPPIPPNYAKLELAGTFLTHPWRNIGYLAISGTGIATSDLNTLAGTINTAWGTRNIANISDQCSLTSVKIVYIPSVGQEILGVSAVAKTGTRVGGFVDNASSSYLVNWNVNRYYRGGHPRWYIASALTADITNGSDLSSSMRTAFNTAFNGFLNDVNAATTTNITSVQLGTLSFQHAGAWRNPPVFWPFVSAVTAAKIATQRRRIHA